MDTSTIIKLQKEIKYSVEHEITKLEEEIDSYGFDTEMIKNIEKISQLGFYNYDYKRLLYERDEKIEHLKNIKKAIKSFPNFKIITIETINRICETYNLLHENPKYYIGEVPIEILKSYKKFKKDWDKRWKSYRDIRTSIIAPKSKFDLSLKPDPKEDPIFIAKVDIGVYAVIHSWGFDKKLIENI